MPIKMDSEKKTLKYKRMSEEQINYAEKRKGLTQIITQRK